MTGLTAGRTIMKSYVDTNAINPVDIKAVAELGTRAGSEPGAKMVWRPLKNAG